MLEEQTFRAESRFGMENPDLAQLDALRASLTSEQSDASKPLAGAALQRQDSLGQVRVRARASLARATRSGIDTPRQCLTNARLLPPCAACSPTSSPTVRAQVDVEDLESLIANMQLAVKQKREYERKLLERAKRTREMLKMAREFALRRILQKRIRRGCRRPFDKMSGNVAAVNRAGGAAMKQRRMDSVMARARGRLMNRSLTAGWAGWVDCVHKRVQKKLLLSRAVRRMKHGKIVHIWEAWYAIIAAKEAKVHKVRQLVGIIRNVRIHAPFRKWHQFAESAKGRADAEAAKKNRTEVIMRRALAKLKHKALLSCFDSWATVLDEKEKNAKILQAVLAKLRFGRESAAFEGWVDFTLERQHQRKVLGRILKQMIHGIIVPAFHKLEDNWRHFGNNDKVEKLEAQGAPELAELRRRIDELRKTIALHDLQLDAMRDQVEAAEFKTRDAENKLKRSDYAGWQRRIKKQETLAKATIALQEQTCLELARAHDELAKFRSAGGAKAGMAKQEREQLQFRADRAEAEARRLRRLTQGMQQQMARYRGAAQKMMREKNAPLAIKGSTFDHNTPPEFGFPDAKIAPDPLSRSLPLRNASRQAAFERSAGTGASLGGSANSQRLWQRKSAVPPTAQEGAYARAAGRTEALALVSTLRAGDARDADVARHHELSMRMSLRNPQLGAAGGSAMEGSKFGATFSRGAAFPSSVTSGSGVAGVHPEAKPWKQAPPEIYAVLKQLAAATGEVDAAGGSGPETGARSLYGEALSSLEAAFRAADKDRSGVLSREEIRDALRRLDISINPSQLRNLIECVRSPVRSCSCLSLSSFDRSAPSLSLTPAPPLRCPLPPGVVAARPGTSTWTAAASWTTASLSRGSDWRSPPGRRRRGRTRGSERRRRRRRRR